MPSFDQIKLVEASLFIAGRPITIEELKKLIDIQKREDIDEIIEKISKNLKERNSFIEIIKIEDAYMMRLKPEIKKEVGKLQSRKSLSDDFMKLLAIIAMKQPMSLSEIRKILPGKKIKENILELEKKGFIQIKTEKRTNILTTTTHFANVFNLDPANMKETFLKMLTRRISQHIITQPKKSKKKDKKKKQILTEEEKREIDKRYYELIEKLMKEREEEKKRLEEETKKKHL